MTDQDIEHMVKAHPHDRKILDKIKLDKSREVHPRARPSLPPSLFPLSCLPCRIAKRTAVCHLKIPRFHFPSFSLFSFRICHRISVSLCLLPAPLALRHWAVNGTRKHPHPFKQASCSPVEPRQCVAMLHSFCSIVWMEVAPRDRRSRDRKKSSGSGVKSRKR